MKLLCIILSCFFCLNLSSQEIEFKLSSETSAINRMAIKNDTRNMNWLIETDGSQYSWVKEKYGWGLGYFTQIKNNTTEEYSWYTPSLKKKSGEIVYCVGDIDITVSRVVQEGDLIEKYSFFNRSDKPISLSNIGIYTPFNDNYPSSEVCMEARTNAHIWDGGHAAYVNAMHMSANAPHLGLILLEGSIDGYNISERSIKKADSNFRGVISLVSSNIDLESKEEKVISWRIFSHNGMDDFHQKSLNKGGALVSCNKYVFETGDTLKAVFASNCAHENVSAFLNGIQIQTIKENECWNVEVPLTKVGDNCLEFKYGKSRITYAKCLVISDIERLIEKRVNFIVDQQQVKDPKNPKYGALLVYDNEKDQIFYNDTTKINFTCFSEGGERLGMGVLLAKYYLIHKDEKIKSALIDYACFIKTKLQDSTYKTWFTYTHEGRNRAYNYPWISSFYFYMYKVTGDKQYLCDGVGTLDAMFRHFGYGFYAIDIPVSLSLGLLKQAEMYEEYEHLKKEFVKIGETYLRTGLNFPKHEVSYEQSIIAPGLMIFAQLYLETKDERYLDELKKQLPVLESFASLQPSYHLNDIAIRHWDGYWLGKRKMWGDVFPHYWSTLSAYTYYYYYKCTGNTDYFNRANNIVRNNLCQFFENGKASCAYLYPLSVNGEKAKFYDPYANDQDWALVYYFLINNDL